MGEYRFEFFSRVGLRGKRWYFRLRAPNGKIMMQSEGYKNRGDAEHAVYVIKREALNAPVKFL